MKILCAVDESEFSLWALECIGKLFRHSVSELVLLHAVDPRILKGGRGSDPKRMSQKPKIFLKNCRQRVKRS